jgi:hypothetical protein
MNDIDHKVDFFNTALKQAASVIPYEYVEMNNCDKPWLSPFVKTLINKRWNAYKKRDWPIFQHLKQKVKSEIVKAKERWIDKSTKNAKSLWKTVNDFRGKTNTAPLAGILCDYDSVYNAACDINKKFEEVFSTSESDAINQLNASIIDDSDWLPLIDELWTFDNLSKLNIAKSTGSDGISNRLYKAASFELCSPITHLINESFLQRIMPMELKITDVSPIPKSSPANIDELRPISQMCVTAKLIEKAVLHHYKSVLYNHIDNNQYAYKPQSSTTCALVDLHNTVTSLLDKKNCSDVFIISCDMSKAFDKISHHLLLSKLKDLCENSSGNCDKPILSRGFVKFLASYLSNRKQRVRIGSVHSNMCDVTSGVPQGSSFGPILFSIFLSDLIEVIYYRDVKIIKYADDIIFIFGSNNTCLYIAKINNILSFMSSYCIKNQLQMNMSKTKILHISHKSNIELELNLKNEYPDIVVNELCYLGVSFTSNLSWNTHINNIVKRASSRLYALRFLKNAGCSQEKLSIVYFGIIRQVLEYACQVFAGINAKQKTLLNRVQRRAHNIICDFKCKCDILPNLDDRRLNLCHNFFIKCLDVSHPLHNIVPNYLPSGRLFISQCNTTCRLNSFIPYCSLLFNENHKR